MTEQQFAFLQQVYGTVAQVADAFGSEDSSSGLVIPTAAATLAAAAVHLPASYQLRPLPYSSFARDYSRAGDAAVARLLTLLTPFKPTAATCAPASFDPQAHSRGRFLLCLFALTQVQAGSNLLLCFTRVET